MFGATWPGGGLRDPGDTVAILGGLGLLGFFQFPDNEKGKVYIPWSSIRDDIYDQNQHRFFFLFQYL